MEARNDGEVGEASEDRKSMVGRIITANGEDTGEADSKTMARRRVMVVDEERDARKVTTTDARRKDLVMTSRAIKEAMEMEIREDMSEEDSKITVRKEDMVEDVKRVDMKVVITDARSKDLVMASRVIREAMVEEDSKTTALREAMEVEVTSLPAASKFYIRMKSTDRI
jgi:hypothetical protein